MGFYTDCIQEVRRTVKYKQKINKLCESCKYKCKQDASVKIHICPNYTKNDRIKNA